MYGVVQFVVHFDVNFFYFFQKIYKSLNIKLIKIK